jgi:hypothetical protein
MASDFYPIAKSFLEETPNKCKRLISLSMNNETFSLPGPLLSLPRLTAECSLSLLKQLTVASLGTSSKQRPTPSADSPCTSMWVTSAWPHPSQGPYLRTWQVFQLLDLIPSWLFPTSTEWHARGDAHGIRDSRHVEQEVWLPAVWPRTPSSLLPVTSTLLPWGPCIYWDTSPSLFRHHSLATAFPSLSLLHRSALSQSLQPPPSVTQLCVSSDLPLMLSPRTCRSSLPPHLPAKSFRLLMAPQKKTNCLNGVLTTHSATQSDDPDGIGVDSLLTCMWVKWRQRWPLLFPPSERGSWGWGM